MMFNSQHTLLVMLACERWIVIYGHNLGSLSNMQTSHLYHSHAH